MLLVQIQNLEMPYGTWPTQDLISWIVELNFGDSKNQFMPEKNRVNQIQLPRLP